MLKPAAVVATILDQLKGGETGATVRPSGELVTSGVVVAIEDSPELRIAGPDRPRMVAEWLESSADLLQADSTRCVGAWLDSAGRLCLDVVEVVDTLERALELGRARQEEAVFCLDTGTEYPCS